MIQAQQMADDIQADREFAKEALKHLNDTVKAAVLADKASFEGSRSRMLARATMLTWVVQFVLANFSTQQPMTLLGSKVLREAQSYPAMVG